MADHETTLSTAPPADNPVAMAEVGEPDQPEEQQADSKGHDRAVEAAEGDIAQAATSFPDTGNMDVEAVPDEQLGGTVLQEPTVTDIPDDTLPPAEETSTQDVEAQEETGLAATTDDQARPSDIEVLQPEEDNATPAKSAQSDAGGDDLFGSEASDIKETKTEKSGADTDSVVEAISSAPQSPSADDMAQDTVAQDSEDDNDDHEDMPKRKKHRGESPASGDEDEANAREFREETDVKEDHREDDEDERTAEPEETDEALARKRALDARIEAIGKGNKRKRSRKKDDSEDLGLDRQIEEMTTMMDNAIRNDIEMNKIRKPALSKTQILNKVIAVLQNASLQQSILESNDFLSTLRRFIEPMEDGSLPSLTIQKGILFQLGRLEGLEVIHLRNSGLGKVVNFYTRCKSCQPEIIRQANLLIDRWSKPILDTGNNARASARARAEAEREDHNERHAEGGERGEGASTGESGRPKDRKALRSGALLYQKVQADKEKGADAQKSSRLPSHIGHAYAVAPAARRSAKGPEEQAMEEARQRELERINRFKKKALQASR
ncbi:hypothetical protein QFC19_005019 [Naganishia cerealis]|uniref:Uncharacterized protein n=1 Tax=Naganishia cerealis TaxID=610337 RepID=A0ACC2VRY8_9TREE|nr:hypothetical protein QFC19_005019 [Naganishia cerealis]